MQLFSVEWRVFTSTIKLYIIFVRTFFMKTSNLTKSLSFKNSTPVDAMLSVWNILKLLPNVIKSSVSALTSDSFLNMKYSDRGPLAPRHRTEVIPKWYRNKSHLRRQPTKTLAENVLSHPKNFGRSCKKQYNNNNNNNLLSVVTYISMASSSWRGDGIAADLSRILRDCAARSWSINLCCRWRRFVLWDRINL